MACDVAIPSLRLTPFPPPRWAIMPESDDVVIGNVAEDGDLGAKSLYISRAVSYFFGLVLCLLAVGQLFVLFITILSMILFKIDPKMMFQICGCVS